MISIQNEGFWGVEGFRGLGVGKFGHVWASLGKLGQVWASLGKFGQVWASFCLIGLSICLPHLHKTLIGSIPFLLASLIG